MKYRKLVETLCEKTQARLERSIEGNGGAATKIVFTIEEKEPDYYIPDIPLGQEVPTEKQLCAEIFLGGICVFRVMQPPPFNEEKICQRMLILVFTHGIAESYNVVIKRGLS